jgi:hypothetical protein
MSDLLTIILFLPTPRTMLIVCNTSDNVQCKISINYLNLKYFLHAATTEEVIVA